MRQLLPTAVDDVDPADAYAADARPAPPGRPWVLLNMVASLDGATAVDGVSGPLGGPGDRAVFAAVRAVPDVVVAAAATVNAERYGPARPTEEVRAARRARGQTEVPRLAVITGSLSVDLSAPLFADDAHPRPLVLTGRRAPAERRAEVARRAEVVEAGPERVDLARALGVLAEHGHRTALVEGGPSLNGQLVAAGLVDEVCLTIAPTLVGGTSARIAPGPDTGPTHPMRLDRLLAHDDGTLFCRYVRTDP